MTDKLFYERQLINSGCKYVCGTDEVGRGPLAGPVVCAAVVMPFDCIIEGVDDSKLLSAKKREILSAQILEKAVAYSISLIEPKIIDEINILEATKLCMKNAVEGLKIKCSSPNQLVRELSGGNKQKVSFGKWIGNRSRILVFDSPTRGVDVGVKTTMYQLLYELKKQNYAILIRTAKSRKSSSAMKICAIRMLSTI